MYDFAQRGSRPGWRLLGGGLLMLLVAGSAAWAWQQKQPSRGLAHPETPDPVILAFPDAKGYAVFATGRGLNVWRSNDLRLWTSAGKVFPDGLPNWVREAVPENRGSVWAPDISFFNGKHHLYYSVSTFGSQRSVIGLAVNEAIDPERPSEGWKDQGLVIASAPGETDHNAIDPALFRRSGRRCLPVLGFVLDRHQSGQDQCFNGQAQRGCGDRSDRETSFWRRAALDRSAFRGTIMRVSTTCSCPGARAATASRALTTSGSADLRTCWVRTSMPRGLTCSKAAAPWCSIVATAGGEPAITACCRPTRATGS